MTDTPRLTRQQQAALAAQQAAAQGSGPTRSQSTESTYEDVDTFIEKISAIYEYSHSTDVRIPVPKNIYLD
jgi:hypothetical protein